ncbi:MAG: glycosyltransferase family A protein [Bacteroidota bacterium]
MREQALLSIQFPSTIDREEVLNKLVTEFVRQIDENKYHDIVCMEFDNRGKEVSIGEKRNDLYKKAWGKYVVQWDSDDGIHSHGLRLIIEALKNNPDVDCCTYEEYINIDGVEQRSNHDLKYGDWNNNEDGYDYVRTPFMKSVIKTEIAKSVPVPFIRFAEDHQWAQSLKPHLKTQVHISEQIYRYIHISSDHNERYGIKD